MARTIIPISLDGTTVISGDPATGDKAQAAIAAAIAAAAADTDVIASSTAPAKVAAISTAISDVLANEPQIVLSYDASLSRGQVSRALKDHL